MYKTETNQVIHISFCKTLHYQIVRREDKPSLSIVSLILLAAFSLRSPGWLLLMENSVMTPEIETRKWTGSVRRQTFCSELHRG